MVKRPSGQSEPVPIRQVRTGEQLLCFDGGVDMRLPGEPRWCEVRNWVSAPELLHGGRLRARAAIAHALRPAPCARLPTALQVRAEEAWFTDMIRINFTAADGSPGSTTNTAGHIMHLLTAARAGQTAKPTAKDCEFVSALS